MIQTSSRTLLTQITRAFCKDTTKQNKPNKPKDSLKIFSKKTTPLEQDSQAEQPQKNYNKKQKNYKEKKQKLEASQNKNKNKNLEDKQPGNVDWSTIRFSKDKQKKLEELNKSKADFSNLYENNNLESDLSKDISEINVQSHTANFVNHFSQYIKRDPTKAINFFITQGLLAKPTSQQAIAAMIQVKKNIVEYYLITQNLEELNNFFQKLGKYYTQNKGSLNYDFNTILSHIQMITQFPNSPIKYKVLSNFLKIIKVETKKPEALKKWESAIKRILDQFQFSKDVHKKQNTKQVQYLIQLLVENKIFPSKVIKSPTFYSLLRRVYYHQLSQKERQARFLKLLGAIKSSFISQNDYTETYFLKFYKSLMISKLESTNCQKSPVKVTAQLIKAYQKMFSSKNKQGLLAIVAICLINKYLSIPDHFLKNHQTFTPHFPDPLISLIKQEYNFLQLDEYVKKGNQKALKELQKTLMKSNKFRNKLKTSILTKDYQTAMSIYHKEIFRSVCIKKEKMITKKVLMHIINEENQEGLTQRQNSQFNKIVNHYVQKLSHEYLWQSWKKREDIGYLLQDYYIREGQQQQKTQKRFSFYDTYFEIKRARQINKFEKLNELNIIKEPNQHPFVEKQFNLNEYLKPENYKRYREVADYDDQKYNELFLYFTRVEATLLQLRDSFDEKLAAKMITYQQNLNEENLKYLEQFGLKDYDITVHDIQQFKNRLDELKKYRGVKRLSSIYNRLYPQFNEQAIKEIFQQNPQPFVLNALKPVEAQVQQKQAEEKEQEVLKVIDQISQHKEELKAQQQQSQQSKPIKQEQKKKPKKKKANVDENDQQDQESTELKIQVQGQENLQKVEDAQALKEPTGQSQVGLQSIHISTTDPSAYFKMHDQIEHILNNSQFLDLVRVRRRQLFAHYSAVVKLSPDQFVDNLILWGLIFKQPMAIYMGEKLAMMTGQLIPHYLAIRVSDLFSQYRQVDEELFVQCKKCLTYIGKIDRQFIYDSNKSYQHIISKNFVERSTANFDKGLLQRLQALTGTYYDLKSRNNEPSEVLKRASKGPVF